MCFIYEMCNPFLFRGEVKAGLEVGGEIRGLSGAERPEVPLHAEQAAELPVVLLGVEVGPDLGQGVRKSGWRGAHPL